MNIIHKDRIQWLDSLRGISALMVAFTHVTSLILEKEHIHNNSVYYSWMLGRIGVIIFFLISGFVIPYSLHNKSLGQFSITRFFRLYPAYWLSIVAMIAISGLVPLKRLLANVTMFQKLFGAEDMIGVYWTLQIELFFYFICAALFYIGYLYKEWVIELVYFLMILVAIIFAIERFYTFKKLPVAFPLSLSVMFLGFLFRNHYYHNDEAQKKRFFRCLAGFVIAIIPIAFLAYDKDYGFNEKWWQYLFSYLIAVIVFITYSKTTSQNKLLLFFGQISYSLYLFHQLVINLMERYNLYQKLNHFFYVFIFFSVSIAVAASSYYLVEKPFVKLGKKILKKRFATYHDLKE